MNNKTIVICSHKTYKLKGRVKRTKNVRIKLRKGFYINVILKLCQAAFSCYIFI